MSEKISDFVVDPVVTDDGLLTYVKNGQNFTIKQSDYVAQLGVTGSIVQAGDVLGVPVLDTQGTVNNIRNIEASVGVTAEVSPQNGIALKTALLPAGLGAEVLFNQTTAPQFRSLIAGTGINVAVAGNSIQISESGVAAGTKTVLVTQLSDFPAAVSGARTLEANTEYFIQADITTSDRFILQDATVVSGPDILIGMFAYTGTGDFFTAVDATCKVKNIQLQYLTANQCFNISNSAGNEGLDSFLLDRVSLAGTKVGTFTSLANLQLLQSTVPLITTSGFTLAGTGWDTALFTNYNCVISAGKFFDLGSTVFMRFATSQMACDIAAGATFLSGVSGSANIDASGAGSVISGQFKGAGDILSGVTVDDARWDFLLNDDLADTRTDGLLSMQGNATATTITVAGVSVLVAGTWVVESDSRMTGTTGGRLTYDGRRDDKLPITSSVTIEPVSGGAQIMSAFIAIDGVEVANSQRSATSSPGSPASITLPWQENFSTTRFVEIFVTNETTTNNVLVSSAIHRVN